MSGWYVNDSHILILTKVLVDTVACDPSVSGRKDGHLSEIFLDSFLASLRRIGGLK